MKTITRLFAFVALVVAARAQQPTFMYQARVTNSEIIGANAIPATAFQVIDIGTGTPRGITNDQYNAGTNSAQFNLRKARGTFASPTTIVTGDILGRTIYWGHDGTQFIESANIRATSSGTIGTNRVPSQIEFYTSTNAAPSVLTLAGTIDSAQLWTLANSLVVPTKITISSTSGTSAGGLLFGTDINFYRESGGKISFNHVGGTDPTINFYANGSLMGQVEGYSVGSAFYINAATGNSLILRTNGSSTALTLDASQNAMFAGAYIGSTQALSGAGAADITHETTKLTTAGTGDAITLANGTNGQVKRLVLDVLTSGGHTSVLTPTTKTGFSTVTLTAAGQTVSMQYNTTRGWVIIGSFGATIAP